MKKIFFLYTELASYTLACLKALAFLPGTEVHVVRWPVNPEAPFKFDLDERIKFYDRKNFNEDSLNELLGKVHPDVIVCSGWIDKDYLRVCRKWKGKAATVVAMDNQWTGSLRQRLGTFLDPNAVRRTFTHAWVPGKLQREFAERLGFNNENILDGFYSADTEHFIALGKKFEEAKKKNFPKIFIFAGRYYEFKGVKELWSAFSSLYNEGMQDWQLYCLGTGDIEPMMHPAIKHFGFVQPGDMERFIGDCGVFVLPSRFEPWGVVLHEFTAAGFPVVCSDAAGARTAFLEEGKNGFVFNAGDTGSLKCALKKIMEASPDYLIRMSRHSAILGSRITPASWAKKIRDVRH